MYLNSSFSRSVARLGGGTVVAQVLAFLAVPLIARLYSVEEIGALGVFGAALGMLAMFGSGRFELAIPLPDSDADALSIVALCVLVAVTVSFCLGLLVMLAPPSFFSSVGLGGAASVLWVLPLALFGALLVQALSWWATREGQFGVLGRTKILQAGSMAAVQVSAGLLFPTLLALVVGHSLGLAAGVRSLFSPWKHEIASHFRALRFADVVRVAGRYRRFPLLAMPGAVLTVGAATHLPVLLATTLYGTAAGAKLFLVQKLLAAPTMVLGQATAQVATSSFARTNRSDPSKLFRQSVGLTMKMMVAGVLIFGVGAIVAPSLGVLILGDQWSGASGIIRSLMLLYWAQFSFLPVMQLFNVLEWQASQLSWGFLRFVVAGASLLVADRLGESFETAVLWFSLGQMTCVALMACYCIARSKGHLSNAV